MQKLSNEFNDNPISASEKIVYWTEYVIRHRGTPHLKTMGLKTPLYQYLFLDVIVCFGIVAAFIVTVVYIGRMTIAVMATKRAAHPTKKVN